MSSPLPRKILVPVDVAEVRWRGLRLAMRLAQINGAEILLLTVVDDRFPYPDIFSLHMPDADYYRHVRERACRVLEEAAREAPEGVTVRPVVSRGKPARVIAEVAEEEGVDLIVMTSHATRGLEHAILGSVTDRVLHTAPCPVLVIPIRGERPHREEGA